jgi:mRNA degradation ribonuclease J1/J2
VRGGELSLKKEDVKVRYVVVDGDLKGDLSSQVLKERGILAQNGLVGVVLRLKGGKMVGDSVIYTRGFVYPKDLPRITREIEKRVKSSVDALFAKGGARLKEADYEERVRGDVAGFIVQKFDRRPLVNITAIFV